MFKQTQVIKELFNTISLLSKKVTEKFEDGKVYSDSEIKLSDRTVGASVELIGKDGELSPAPDGDYQLEGDFKFTVKDGVIASIEGEEAPKEDEVKAADEMPNETPAEAPDDIATMKDQIAQLQETTKAIVASIEELKAALNNSANQDDFNSMKTAITNLNEAVLAFSQMPVEFSKTNTSTEVKNDKDNKMSAFVSVLNKINSKN